MKHLLDHKESVKRTLLTMIENQEVLQNHYRVFPPSEPVIQMNPFENFSTPDTKPMPYHEDDAKSCVSIMSCKSNVTLPLRSNRAERLRLAAGRRRKIVPKISPIIRFQ